MTAARTDLHVVVAGGGMAGLETILALRVLAGPRPRVTLVTDASHVLDRPATVAEPFDRALARSYDISVFAREQDVELRFDRLLAVRPGDRVAQLANGEALAYDALVVATGSTFAPPLPGATPFRGGGDVAAVRAIVDELRRGAARSVAFALPDTAAWPLPLYELALLTGAELRAAEISDVRLVVVTPEATPLCVFGPAAAEALVPLLADRRVSVRTGTRPLAFAGGRLEVAGEAPIAVDRVIAVSAPRGRAPLGLPHDARGFVPVDAHGRVAGLTDVYAAGDVTDGSLKQGGLAAQQADAVAEAIAASIGAIDQAQPVRPVVRGVLLVGGEPLYLRAELPAHDAGPETARRSQASARPLWTPPAKVAARYLSPYFATARPGSLHDAALADRPGPPAAA